MTQHYYETATITIRLGTMAAAVAAIKDYVSAADAKGRLVGCWFSDIGHLNEILVLREFTSLADLDAEQQRGAASANPFGAAEHMTQYSVRRHAGFPWLGPVATGALGPVYEVRTYQMKHGGLQPTLDAWKNAWEPRTAISPCALAMYALDDQSLFTHIWPFPDLNTRSKARADAVAQGVWPPKGGPAWLTSNMYSAIFLPTEISPLK